ncbi:MAG: YqcC family protein [Reinekea forsetii]|nr:YqcC family protein [Reinekea forsetii]MDO7643403.1 YqcC family protein [Reinekea forsetii]MDO7672986.1 YqcC family protein [Reinekea forsetii]
MSKSISVILDEIQALMMRDGRWQSMAPSAEAMMSTDPFCINSMDFLEWLQWIYLARLRALIDAGRPMPMGAQVAPYAEEALKAEGAKVTTLIALVRDLDRALA